MLTASGDQSVALWDTLSARRVSAFHGHAGSVKSVCPMPACHDVFASGAPAARPPARLCSGPSQSTMSWGSHAACWRAYGLVTGPESDSTRSVVLDRAIAMVPAMPLSEDACLRCIGLI